MEKRTLRITVDPDWRGALRAAGAATKSESYQGETLNFETPGAFFGRLSERRWALVQALMGAGAMSVRELARRVGRDVKRVHEDVSVLADLGVVERTESGGVVCPFAGIQVEMRLQAVA